jgi:phage terminase small subunit
VNERQRRFADLILEGESQAEAYKKAGYTDNENPRFDASKLIRHPEVADYLAKRREELSKETDVTAKRVIEEFKKIAFSDIGSILEWDEFGVKLVNLESLPPEITAAISEISEVPKEFGKSRKVKLHNKLQALRDLARYLGLYEKGSGNEGDFSDWVRQLEEARKKYGS